MQEKKNLAYFIVDKKIRLNMKFMKKCLYLAWTNGAFSSVEVCEITMSKVLEANERVCDLSHAFAKRSKTVQKAYLVLI